MDNCWISTREARRIIGCNIKELRKLLRINAIKGIRKENNGWLVDKRSAEALSEVLAEIIFRKEQERDSGLGHNEIVEDELERAIPLSDCDLNPRIYWYLNKNGVHTVDQLAKMTKSDLREIHGIGSKSVKVIERALLDFGHILREE